MRTFNQIIAKLKEQPNLKLITIGAYNAVEQLGYNQINELSTLLPSEVEELTVYANIDTKGLELLVKKIMPRLKLLCISDSNIGDEGAEIISKGLQNSTIESLFLYNCKIGTKGVEAISTSLPNSNLKTLSLSANPIGGEGLERIITGLNQSKIEKLDLMGCNISNVAAQVLEGSAIMSQIKKLEIVVGNPDIQADTIGHLKDRIIENMSNSKKLPLEHKAVLLPENEIESKGEIGVTQEKRQDQTQGKKIEAKKVEEISAQPLPPVSIADKKTQDALENLRIDVMKDNSELVSKTLSLSENAHGEFYQYYFDTQSEIEGADGVPNSASNPAGNSVLLLAIARAAFRSDHDKTVPSNMVKSILQDAKSKLTPEELKSFVSSSYKGEIDYFKNSPLTLAIKTDLLDEALTLIEHGANLEDTCNGGYAPLHLAVAKLHFGVNQKLVNVIKSLVEHGANINALDDFGRKPVEALKYEFLDLGGLKKYKLISKNLGVQTGTYSLKELFANETIKNILAAKGILELNSSSQKIFEDIINSRESIRDEKNNRCFTITNDIPQEQDTLIRHLSYSSEPSTKGAMGKIFGYPIIEGIEIPTYNPESSTIQEIEKLLTGELSTTIIE